MTDATQLINTLKLQPHPEGGHYRQTYRANESLKASELPERFGGERAFSTAIYFLLQNDEFSALHKIKQDEIWHFYDGVPLSLHVIARDGTYSTEKLGKNINRGLRPQALVRAGNLFGAALDDPDGFALCGCTVAPGFEFDDFEMPSRISLLEEFPKHKVLIEKLTR